VRCLSSPPPRPWLDEPHVGDHVGRSVWALGEVLATTRLPAVVVPVRNLLRRLIRSLHGDISLRTGAYAALGLTRLGPDRLDPESSRLLDRIVRRLVASHESTSSADWQWFEDALTYDNARLPQALIVGGQACGLDDAVGLGVDVLRWLGDECGLDGSTVSVPGHLGRRRGEPAPGRGDEQPLEAAALVEAELAAFSVTGDPQHRERADAAFRWFLARNRLAQPVFDFATGGCHDGLGVETVNLNEGAESTLAFHQARLALARADVRARPRRPVEAGVRRPREAALAGVR
jgi:hypothetical protein